MVLVVLELVMVLCILVYKLYCTWVCYSLIYALKYSNTEEVDRLSIKADSKIFSSLLLKELKKDGGIYLKSYKLKMLVYSTASVEVKCDYIISNNILTYI